MPLEKSEITSNDSGAKTPASLCEAGLAHLQAGRPLEAQGCCQQALAMDPHHADSLHLMGLLSLDATQHDHAVEWFSRAIRRDPRPPYLTSLGTALLAQSRFEEALRVFDKAVQLKPDDAELWKNLGFALVAAGRPADAVLTFQHVLKLNPRHLEVAYRNGLLLLELERYEEAIGHFELCEELQPNQARVLQARLFALDKLAVALQRQNRFDEAVIARQQSCVLAPENLEASNNLGHALRHARRDEEALPWLDKVLEVNPDHRAALYNKGYVLQQLHRFEEAIAIFLRLKALYPDEFVVERDIEHTLLVTGDFKAGWARREAQWRGPVLPGYYPQFEQPIWLGEEIEDKTLLIYADEGIGDAIHYLRYVPMVAARLAAGRNRVILVVHTALHPMLSALSGVSQCIHRSSVAPAFDMHCPISSLPLLFLWSTDAVPAPYLPLPDPSRVQAWEDRLGPRDKLRVGLVWSGDPGHPNDHNRSMPLRLFADLLDTDATFVSLKKDPNDDDKPALQESSIVDLTAHLTDFRETAALVSCLDLVITVDTSVAHLAAALSRPTWILLPYTPDFRWLLEGDDSHWYPAARLFRQDESRDYAKVLERVRIELEARIAAARDGSASCAARS